MERTHPYLVGSFQGFSDALLLHHGFFNDFQPPRQAVSISKWGNSFS